MKQKYRDALMSMAIVFGQTSEATRRKVGSLVVKGDCIISVGVNGQPPGHITEFCEDIEGNTLPTVRHAEIASFDKLRRDGKINDCKGAEMYVSLSPCLECAKEIHKVGITSVYYVEEYRKTEGLEYLKSKGVDVTKM